MHRILKLLALCLILVAAGYILVPLIAYQTIPNHNTSQKHFDTLIVLGTPAHPDGTPTPELRERVAEGVHEYGAGIAPHLIMTGGAAHNSLVEGQVMADYAVKLGVPRSAIVVEGQARDTIQNIWYSRRIMEQNGWKSAEVISSPYHLPRTALILEHYTGPLAFSWRTQAAEWPPEYHRRDRLEHDIHEALAIVKLRLRGFRKSPYLPAS